jgi:membrane protein implicated in regulation of membrane protease activity
MQSNLLSLSPWQLWCGLAVILAVIEMLTTSFYLACFSVAAIASALVSYFNGGVTFQLVIFALVSFACIVFLRNALHDRIYANSETKLVGVSGMLGMNGLVIEEISEYEPGRVKLRGEEWRALSLHTTVIPAGQQVIVTEVAGATVTVRPV